MQKQIKIADATREQLHRFADANLGIELEGKPQSATIISKIQATGYSRDYILDAGAPVAPTHLARQGGREPFMAESNGRERLCHRILIPMEERPGGKRAVWVSVNGVGMFVERGKPQDVPVEFIEALTNAVRAEYDPTSMENAELGLGEPTPVPSYPFSYV